MLTLVSGALRVRLVKRRQGNDSGFILIDGSVFKSSEGEDVREQIWESF